MPEKMQLRLFFLRRLNRDHPPLTKGRHELFFFFFFFFGLSVAESGDVVFSLACCLVLAVRITSDMGLLFCSTETTFIT